MAILDKYFAGKFTLNFLDPPYRVNPLSTNLKWYYWKKYLSELAQMFTLGFSPKGLSQKKSFIALQYILIACVWTPVIWYDIIYFPVWLWNQLQSAGLEPVLSQTEKLCIASNYRQYTTNTKIKIIKLIPVLSARAFSLSRLTKLVLNLKFFILIYAESCL